MNDKLRLLTRHFLRQFFQTDATSGPDSSLSTTALLGILSMPAALMSIVLFQKYSPLLMMLRMNWGLQPKGFDPDVASLSDKYLFIVFSMTITGIVAVLRWESLFPDRRDFANLAPLPVGTRAILLAKVSALIAFTVLFVVDVNVIASVLFPLIVTGSRGTFLELLRFIAGHMIAVAGAGLWVLAGFLAVTGTMMAALPFAVFRRAKRYAQFASVIALLLLLFSVPAVTPQIEVLRKGGSSWAEWMPSIWFLGLYQHVQGKAMGGVGELAGTATLALFAAIVLAVAAYMLSYRLFFLKSAEAVDLTSQTLRFPDWAFRFLDHLALRTGFERACFRFIVKTIARSDRHTAPIAGIVGLGSVLAALSLNATPYGCVSATLILLYSVAVALRVAFGTPLELRANWLFRMAPAEGANPQAVARRAMFLGVAPVLVVSAAATAWLFGPVFALQHAVFAAIAAMWLIAFLASEFRAIPFTCTWAPGGGNLVYALALFMAGLAGFGQALAGLETFALRHTAPYVVMIAIGLGALWHYEHEPVEPVVFADTRNDLELLHIAD